jgi:hypothetical protein
MNADRGVVPKKADMAWTRNLEMQPRRSGASLFVKFAIVLVILGVIGSIAAALAIHFRNKNKEGSPGNWTEAQIAEKVEVFATTAPPMLARFMGHKELREASRCMAKEVARVYAYDDECFKTSSCNSIDVMRVMDTCLGGQKGSWSAGLRDTMVSEMEEGPTGLQRVVALCAVDTLSRTYSLSEIITKLQVEMSTDALGGAPPQILLDIAKSCGVG